MCGIAGFCGSFSSELLEDMSSSIRHRGPDDQGLIELPASTTRVGFAHTRLSIIDLSPLGKQPLTVHCEKCGCGTNSSQKERLWIIFNGEIYNYRELKKELQSKGHHFHSLTDTEVILHLYAEEGISALKKLNGVFALALFDGRKNRSAGSLEWNEVLVARDGLGVKPLYYSANSEGVLFASELKALLRSPAISTQLDIHAIEQYLAFLWAPSPSTPFTDIKKLKPGEFLILRGKEIRLRDFFYDIPCQAPPIQISEPDALAQTRREIEAAVQRQLVADVPIGAFLSGGLDSSALVATMRKLMPASALHCYTLDTGSLGEREGFASDLPYARKVATYLGVQLHEVRMEASAIEGLQSMLYYLDEPQADPAALSTFLIAQQARKDGLKVLISGTGGDDVFGGYRRHYLFSKEPLLEFLPFFLRQGISRLARGIIDGNIPGGNFPILRRFGKAFCYADKRGLEKMASLFFWNTDGTRRKLFRPSLQNTLLSQPVETTLLETLQRSSEAVPALNRLLYLELKHFLADHNLNYTDKASMAAGVEVRVPLLDPNLISFASSLSPHFKQNGKTGKYLFKKAMEGILPSDVIYRPKTGFGAPIRSWICGELKDLIAETLSPRAIAQRGVFDSSAVQQLILQTQRGSGDAAYTVFSLLCLELWFQVFVDRRGKI